ncbi:MAG: transglutaminase-like domain-containing protein [Candidatus Geothermincolales bacterium]
MEEYPSFEEEPFEEEPRPRRALVSALVVIALVLLAAFLLWEAGILGGLIDLIRGTSPGGWRGFDWQELEVRLTLRARSTETARYLELKVAIPPARPGFQEGEFRAEPAPEERSRDGDREYLVYRFQPVPAELDLVIRGDVFLRRMDLESAAEGGGYRTAEDLAPFLVPEGKVESDAPEIRELAEGIDGETDREAAVEICRLVGRLLEYRRDSDDGGAVEALRRGWGNCTDYSRLMTAVCRARGIPARIVRGLLVERSIAAEEFADHLHQWVEVYLEGCGWVTFDPTMADDDPGMAERLPPFHLALGTGEGDPGLGGGDVWYAESGGGRVEVEWAVEVTVLDKGKGGMPTRSQ